MVHGNLEPCIGRDVLPPPVVMRHVAFLVMFAFFTSYISSSLYFLLYFYLCTLTFVVSPSVMPPTLLYFVTLKWMCSVYISFLVVTFPSHILQFFNTKIIHQRIQSTTHMHHIIITICIAMLPLCDSVMPQARPILYYHASMLTHDYGSQFLKIQSSGTQQE